MQQLLARAPAPRVAFARKPAGQQRLAAWVPRGGVAKSALVPRAALPPACCNASDNKQLVATPAEQIDNPWVTTSKKLVKAAAVCGLAVALALGTVAPAEAARSGGRAGGSSFSSRGSSSRSYSAPSRSSGGMGGGYTSYSAPAVTYMPSVVVPIGVGAPVGMGYGYGGGIGYGLFPTSSIFSLMALAFFAFVAVQTFTSISGATSADGAYAEPVTVAKVQVGLLGLARTLKHDLDTLAMRADTSDARGLHMLLQETVLALLRNPDYYVYGGASAEQIGDGDDAERAFNRASMAERAKFREETLSNVGGVTKRRQLSRREDGVDELMVVTLVVAVEGRLSLPAIRGTQDLRAALNALASVTPAKVVAVELLWTPQADGDYFTRDEVIADYPDLVPL